MKESVLWLFQIVTAVLIFFLLGLHISAQHLGGFGSFPDLAQFTYKALMFVALYHGLFGLRSILLEVGMGRGAEKFVSWILFLGGLVFFIYYGIVAA